MLESFQAGQRDPGHVRDSGQKINRPFVSPPFYFARNTVNITHLLSTDDLITR